MLSGISLVGKRMTKDVRHKMLWTARARQRGLRGGWSLSKTVVDPITGRNWVLLNPEDVNAAWSLFYQTQPKLLVTFLPHKPDGELMIELAIDMCLAQAKAGRYFAFECAELVNCWHLPCMLRLYSVQNAHKNCVGHRIVERGGWL